MKTFAEVFRILPETGWLTESEALFLWEEAQKTTGPILEVGCYHGRSSVLLANLGRTLYCVDPFRGSIPNVDDGDPDGSIAEVAWTNNMNKYDLSARLFMQDIADWIRREVGFAYLDGDHSFFGTVNQIKKALACNPQAIAMHDMNMPSVRAAAAVLGPRYNQIDQLAVWHSPKVVL